MSNKSLVARPDVPREGAWSSESEEAHGLGLAIERQLPHGTIVRGEPDQLTDLEARDFLVKPSRYGESVSPRRADLLLPVPRRQARERGGQRDPLR